MTHKPHTRVFYTLVLFCLILAAFLVALFYVLKPMPALAYEVRGEFQPKKLAIIEEVSRKLPHSNFTIIPKIGLFSCGSTPNALGCYTWSTAKRQIEIDKTLIDENFRKVLIHEIGHYLYNSTVAPELYEDIAWEFVRRFTYGDCCRMR